MPPRKRARKGRNDLAQLHGLNFSSGNAVEAILCRLRQQGKLQSGNYSRRSLRRAVEANWFSDTSYGPVLQRISLPKAGRGDKRYNWTYVHPFAYLSWMCCNCVMFAQILKQCFELYPCSASDPWSLVLYADEIQGGNLLSVDAARKAWAFYFSFLQLPQSILDRELGWLLAGIAPTRMMKKVSGGLSHFFKELMRIFFGGLDNFELTGARLHIDGETFLSYSPSLK